MAASNPAGISMLPYWWPALMSIAGTALIVVGVLGIAFSRAAALIPLGLGLIIVAWAASIGNL